jgi:hypothetical protein
MVMEEARKRDAASTAPRISREAKSSEKVQEAKASAKVAEAEPD